MRNSKSAFAIGAILFSTCIPVHAQGLFGGGDGEGLDLGSVLSIDSGSASSDSLVGVGLGGDDGNVLDVSLGGGGGGSSLATANISSGGGSDGGLGVNANVLGGAATADVNVGGGGVGARVNVLGGGPGGVDVNINVRPPTINIPGVIPTIPGVPAPRLLNASVGGQVGLAVGGAGGFTPAPGCGSDVAGHVAGLMDGTSVDSSWASASGVQVQRVEMCSSMRDWVTEHLDEHGHASILHPAVQADSLISASLARSPYNHEHVFAVRKQGSKLVVYVY